MDSERNLSGPDAATDSMPTDPSDRDPVEGLLLGASRWEPDRPCPPGLSARALARHRPLWGVRIPAWLPTGAVAACATAAIVVLSHVPFLAGPSSGDMRDAISTAAVSTPRFQAHALAAAVEPSTRPAAVAVQSVSAGPPARSRNPRGEGSRVAAHSRRSARPKPPVARWEVEEVQETVTGAIREGWILQPGPEPGELVFVPGLLHSHGTLTPAGYEPRGEGVIPASYP